MSWLENNTIQVLSTAMTGLQARTQAIASNISNVDTPGYRPVSVDFESELQRQLADSGISVAADGTVSTDATASSTGGRVASVTLARTAAGHLSAPDQASASGVAISQGLDNYRNDGNAVDVDASMTSLAETQLKYSSTTRLLSGEMGMLRDVITDTAGR